MIVWGYSVTALTGLDLPAKHSFSQFQYFLYISLTHFTVGLDFYVCGPFLRKWHKRGQIMVKNQIHWKDKLYVFSKTGCLKTTFTIQGTPYISFLFLRQKREVNG